MNLRDWQARHGFTYDTAAAALGVSRRTYARLLKREALPKLVELAMKRIDDESLGRTVLARSKKDITVWMRKYRDEKLLKSVGVDINSIDDEKGMK